jgi:hypothetical protein
VLDADNPQSIPSQSAFAQLRSATGILALLSRHEDDARLQNLFDNLWLAGQRFRSHMKPTGFVNSPVNSEQIPCGDRWANEAILLPSHEPRRLAI